MELTRCSIVVSLAMILCVSVNHAHFPLSYDEIQCSFHASHDPQDSCLLGGKKTSCGFYRCFQTVGKSCSIGHEMKLNGQECGNNLMCGCDKKCNGCMTVNGEKKCHYAECLPFGKRSQTKMFPLAQLETQENNMDYPLEYPMSV